MHNKALRNRQTGGTKRLWAKCRLKVSSFHPGVARSCPKEYLNIHCPQNLGPRPARLKQRNGSVRGNLLRMGFILTNSKSPVVTLVLEKLFHQLLCNM